MVKSRLLMEEPLFAMAPKDFIKTGKRSFACQRKK